MTRASRLHRPLFSCFFFYEFVARLSLCPNPPRIHNPHTATAPHATESGYIGGNIGGHGGRSCVGFEVRRTIAYLPLNWIVDEHSGDVSSSLCQRALAGVGYPNLTKGYNSAANHRVRERSHRPREARSQPIRQPNAKGESG
jgi:hypothetical protein